MNRYAWCFLFGLIGSTAFAARFSSSYRRIGLTRGRSGVRT